jgi:hypothetical protein
MCISWLAIAHLKFDAAVVDAYGSSVELTEE